MRRGELILATCAACGRVGFDDRAGPDGAVGPAFVQATCQQPSGTLKTLAAPFVNDVRAGDLLVVSTDFLGTTQTGTVADTLGDAFQALPIARSPAQTALIWYAIASASGSDTVTLTLDATSTSVDLDVHEYAGVSSIDAALVTTGKSAAPAAPTLAVTAGELMFAFGVIVTATVTQVTPPFTPRETCHRNLTADGVAPSTGNYTATFSADGSFEWVARIVTFR